MRCSTIWKPLSSAAATAVACLLLAGCNRSDAVTSGTVGDAERGRALAVQYGCSACHAIPKMPTTGMVGPPLSGIVKRAYLAGRIPNTVENMLHWIRFPHQVDPDTVMPNMGVSESDARDLTAFSYGLQ